MADNDDELPRFFKVFLSETASESMAIPLSFMDVLENPLPETVKLQGTGGRTWTVSLTKIRRQAYLTAGWSKFAEEHELEDGEFLTFVYDGSRTFEVSVYGRMGCKVTRAVAVPTIELIDSDSESHEEEEEDDDDDSSFHENEEISQSVYTLDSEETEAEDAFVAGSSNVGISANPCFKTCLKPRIYELLIPASVVRNNRLEFGEMITYIDEEGITQGKRGKWSDDRVCFKGWDRICRRNKLKEQDVVTCEILHNNYLAHSIKIHITRA
uniref:B3 domain-containing protein REM20 n=1 Tax=Noccaea caerulescens TaxID=107243 RepID=A0A1J3HF64_NOCCA